MKKTNTRAFTWKIATALDSNNLVSAEASLPLSSLHLISVSASLVKPFSSYFFFITSASTLGRASAPWSRKSCKAA